MEVVQELAELCVGDGAVALLAEVELDKVTVEWEGETVVQGRLLNDAGKLV